MKLYILLFYFILCCVFISSAKVTKDTCYTKFDSVNKDTLTICIKIKKRKRGVVVTDPSFLFSKSIDRLISEDCWVVKTKYFVKVYEGKKLICKSYLRTRRDYAIKIGKTLKQYKNWPDISENAKNKINDKITIKRNKITRWNEHNTKETLKKINNKLDYKHIVYDSKDKKIKKEILNNDKINWKDWKFENE